MIIKKFHPVKHLLLLAVALTGIGITALVALAQTKSIGTLKHREAALRQQVEQTERLLRQTKSIKRKSFNELLLLRKQISLRENLVQAIDDEIEQINREVMRIEGIMGAMEEDVDGFRKSYAKAARHAYLMQDDMTTLLFLMSSGSFAQAYGRMVYFRELAKYRKNQIDLIRRTRLYLARKKDEKENKLRRQRMLKGERVMETGKLSSAQKEKDRLYHELKGKESDYQRNIERYKKELAAIRQQIRKMVEAAPSSSTMGNKDVVNQLDQVFEKNRNKLPWPIPMNKGVITGYFGRSRTATGGEVINDGIYISTGTGQEVRAVFDGKVTMIGRIPNYGRVVIIQHGSYRTVYANLENVFVNNGDKVTVLQNIGTVKTNTDTGETQLYFQIYRSYNPVNPLSWLTGK